MLLEEEWASSSTGSMLSNTFDKEDPTVGVDSEPSTKTAADGRRLMGLNLRS